MIRVVREGALCRIRIDRSEKANALTVAMLDDLAGAAESARDAKVMVLTGTGKVFSAGADTVTDGDGIVTDPVWERVSAAIAALPCLTIAALNGTLAGGAFGMVLACDLRVTVAGANFFYPVMKRGFLPQKSDPARLAALIGPARAKLILMAGARLTAAEALQIGLVDRVAEDLDATVAELSTDALAAAPDNIAAIKAMIDGR